MRLIWTGNASCLTPLCTVCGKRLSNASMTPAKLRRHFPTNDSHIENKSADYSKRLLESLKTSAFFSEASVGEKALVDNYLVAEINVQKRKSHAVVEYLILPDYKIRLQNALTECSTRN